MPRKRNDGDLPVPFERIAEERITRARAIKLAGAMGATGAFALFTGGTAEARPNRRRRRRRRRRRQRAVTSDQSTINFGDTILNVPATEFVTITNEGDTPVTINPTLVGDGFTLGDLSGLDLTLEAGESVKIPVILNALEEGVKTGKLRILDARDGLVLEVVELVGEVNVL